MPSRLECGGVHYPERDFRDALDRKRSFTVAACRDVPFGVDHDQAEASGVDPGQFGNIGRDLAPIRPLPHLVGYFPYDKVKVGHGVWDQDSNLDQPV